MEDGAGGAELLGFWALGHGFDSAMDDEFLMFSADGTGWCESLRPWYSDRTEFRWKVTGSGQVRVEAHRQIVTDEWDGAPQVEEHAIDRVEVVRYAITMGSRPLLAGPVRQLAVEMSFASAAPFGYVRAG